MSKEKEPNEEHFGENAFENTKKKCQPIELEPQNSHLWNTSSWILQERKNRMLLDAFSIF